MVSIVGIGSYLPDKILTNSDLEKMVETSDQWIIERTGIRERRIASDDVSNSDMAAHAAIDALRNARIKSEEVDLIIVATMSPDMISPSTACLVQKKIDAKNAACFDLSAACSGFLYGIDVASKLIASGGYHTVLVIGSEKLSNVIDWKDRGTCILFGDGAGAAVLKRDRDGHEIVGTILGSDGSGSDLLKIPAGGSLVPASYQTVDDRLHFIKMDGREVFKRAIDIMSKVSLETLSRCSLKIDDIALFLPHQANKRIIDAVAKKLQFPSEKIYVNVDRFGNTSAASVIIALDEIQKSNGTKRGDYILMVVFGAGWTWGGGVIKW